MNSLIKLVVVSVLGAVVSTAALAEPMTTEETRVLMQEYLKYQQSGKLEDYPKWGAFYADDIEVHYHTTGPLGMYFFGREGFVEWYRQLAEGVDFSTGAKADHRALLVDGNVAMVRFGVRSRRNGVPYINEYVHIYTWEDQKIVYMEAFYNGAAADAYRRLARGD